MRNIKIRVEYDGTDFSGWQRQKNAPSIQQFIEEAAEKVFQHKISIVGAGRTDSGVHAFGQVANFRTEWTLSCESIPFAINSHLPPAIRITQAEEVPIKFHACHSATGKHYRYNLWNSKINPAIYRKFVAVYRRDLDVGLMKEAVKPMLGKRDFRAFRTSAKGQEGCNTVKEVWDVLIRSTGRWILFDVIGSGFLYNQVRTMVGTLIEVGRGKLSLSSVEKILVSGDRCLAGPTMPAKGLWLMQVFYGPIPERWNRDYGPVICEENFSKEKEY